MYRARAEAVSGTRVYADGKWLRCIGNKCISVGDFIWTDGRCVYGHEQESQQPQVITAPQEAEGIPIILGNELYTFEKNRLKRMAKICFEGGKVNFYKDVAGELIFVDTMPNTDKWTDFSLMINDHRQTAFLYDAGIHYKAGFYNSTNWSNVENNFYTDTKLIASNIDKAGNRFDMVIRYKSEWIEDDGEQVKEIQETAVEILKNGKVVKSVKLQPIVDKLVSDTPDSDAIWKTGTGYEINAYSVSSSYNVSTSFIEDDQTWWFWFMCSCSKDTNFKDDPVVTTDDVGGWWMIGGKDTQALDRLYLITADEQKIISESSLTKSITMKDPYTPVRDPNVVTTTHIPQAILPLQDGYYCKIYDLFTSEDIFGVEATLLGSPSYSYVTVYSPRDVEIFTGITILPCDFPICRIGGKYLLNVYGNAFFLGMDKPLDVYNDVRVLKSGLYLISGDNWTLLCDKVLSNQRLRPMKKIRGWQNRIQLIELDQEEI